MAYIKEKKRNGKVISYVFTTCLERDAQGKQVRKYLTWKPPENPTPANRIGTAIQQDAIGAGTFWEK